MIDVEMAKRTPEFTGPERAPAVSLDATMRRRAIVEGVEPQIDGGRFPIKRTIGDEVRVSADVFADGRDTVVAVVRCRHAGDVAWRDVRMSPVGNDRWQASFSVTALGRYQYTVEAWIDRFATWQHDLSERVGAGQDVSSELLEGVLLVRSALERQPAGDADVPIQDLLSTLAAGTDRGQCLAAALSEELAAFMAARPDRSQATSFDRVLEVIVDRERARFGAWYELSLPSAGPDPSPSATFAEAADMLPYVASMGFDVLALPPIQAIGGTLRQGRITSLTSTANGPGRPGPVGSEEAGRTMSESSLGTIEEFDAFVAAARVEGLDIALDIALRSPPDPHVSEHPDWFRRRPDGAIEDAESPAKTYPDIYPFTVESGRWRSLWLERKHIFEFWIEHGVKIFRVDDPHTMPFGFWEWAITDLTVQDPDVLFLSGAFSRPKVMKYLAKVGFTQSYTYFTWRTSRDELVEYVTELRRPPVCEYLRPNLFANTPDILLAYLQRGGRPAFQVRFVLSATLGASYGIYDGFELGENVAPSEGHEGYSDSARHPTRLREYQRADSFAELIGRINAIRRTHPALQHDSGLAFHRTDNGELLAYSKRSPDGRDLIFVVVNLDCANMQHGFVQLPLVDWGVTPHATIEVVDLLSGERYFWRGEWNYVRLDPQDRVAHILHVQRSGPLPAPADHA